MSEQKDLWDEKPNPNDFFIVVHEWTWEKRFDVSAYLNKRDAWLEKVEAERSDLTNDLMDAERKLEGIQIWWDLFNQCIDSEVVKTKLEEILEGGNEGKEKDGC